MVSLGKTKERNTKRVKSPTKKIMAGYNKLDFTFDCISISYSKNWANRFNTKGSCR